MTFPLSVVCAILVAVSAGEGRRSRYEVEMAKTAKKAIKAASSQEIPAKPELRELKGACERCIDHAVSPGKELQECMTIRAEAPFTSWKGSCSVCEATVSFEAKGDEAREEVSALLAQATFVPPARKLLSKFDQAGTPDAGRQRLAELADRLGRRWGASTALPLSVAPVARLQRLPFGILMLDWLSGGGLAIGRWNRIWGKKSTLKSTLCLRVLRQAQRTCRHCKFPIVADPENPLSRDCRCPNPRYWLKDEADYQWLQTEAAIRISYGMLPEAARKVKIKGEGEFFGLHCEPPEHLAEQEKQKAADAKAKGEKYAKQKAIARDILFVEAPRCEPMRCLYLDSEQTITHAWALDNGVDTSLVLLVGAEWAEQSFANVEDAVLTREFDLIIIDSTSVLETKENLEKTVEQRQTVASRANKTGQFVRRLLSAGFEGLTARHRPTILCTSQVTTHGIGFGQHAYLAPTDGNVLEHALSIDIRMTEAGYQFDKEGQKAVYGEFDFQVTKNKASGNPGVGSKIRFWLTATPEHPVGDSDDLAVVMAYARDFGRRGIADFINETSKGLELRSGYVRGGSMIFKRVGDCETFLRTNITIYDDLRERVLSRLRAADAGLVDPTKPVPAAVPAQT